MAKNEDIADPYVVIRNKNKQDDVAYEVTLPYFKRKLEIDLKSNLSRRIEGEEEYQICLLAKDSKTFVRRFYAEQCRDLSGDLSGSSLRVTTSVILLTVSLFLRFI